MNNESYTSPNPDTPETGVPSNTPQRWSSSPSSPSENASFRDVTAPKAPAEAPVSEAAPQQPAQTASSSCTGGCGGSTTPPSGGSTPPSGGNGGSPKKPASHRTLKFVAAALALTLVGGLAGGAISGIAAHNYYTSTTSLQKSDRTPTKVQEVKVDGKAELSNAENYKANAKSVVSINVGTETNFFGQIVEQPSSGSGFILTPDGYIMTNFHVVKDASTIKVTTFDGETYDAAYIGGDEDYDIAVIKVLAQGLPAVVIGDSTAVQVGDDVIAIGNPLGELTFSLTSGSVSSANRAITVGGSPFNMIQVNCAINPGNSGGPLLNTHGEVIGVVSAKYSTYGNTTVEGVGFAIPISDVYSMVKDIMENGYVTNKAYFGIKCSTVDRNAQIQYNLPIDKGVYVHEITAGGPAAQSELRPNDIIIKIDNTDINTKEDLISIQRAHRSGDTVKLTVYRDGKNKTFDFTFGAMPEPAPAPEAPANSGGQGGQNGQGSMGPSDIFDLFPFMF